MMYGTPTLLCVILLLRGGFSSPQYPSGNYPTGASQRENEQDEGDLVARNPWETKQDYIGHGERDLQNFKKQQFASIPAKRSLGNIKDEIHYRHSLQRGLRDKTDMLAYSDPAKSGVSLTEEKTGSHPTNGLWETSSVHNYNVPVKRSVWKTRREHDDPTSIETSRKKKENSNDHFLRTNVWKSKEPKVYLLKQNVRETKGKRAASEALETNGWRTVEESVANVNEGTKRLRRKSDTFPSSRSCGGCCSSRPSCGGCQSNRICCTNAGSCDPTGANSPSARQKTTQLAQDSAVEAQAASDAQQCAGLQAAFQVRSQLAEKACQASNAAQAALAGKQAVVEALQEQISDAEAVLQEQLVSLCNLQNTAQMACQLTGDSQIQLQVLSSAFQNARVYSDQANVLVQAMQQVKEEKEALINCIQRQLEALLCQLNVARQELEDTCRAAQCAAKSAEEAQENAQRCCKRTLSAEAVAALKEEQEHTQRCHKRTLPTGAESAGLSKNNEDPSKSAEFADHNCDPSESDLPGSEASNCSPGICAIRGCGRRKPSYCQPCCGGSACCPPRCVKPRCGGGGPSCEVCGANSPENRAQLTQSAQCAAQEAEAASVSQIPAGRQASYQVRAQLAEKACQLSNAAQAALAGKQATVDHLEGEIKDAEDLLNAELSTFHIVQCTLEMAQQEACVGCKQLQTLGCTWHVAQSSVATMAEISRNVDLLRDQKAQLIEEAKRQIEQLLCQLNDARQDLDATCAAAQQAAAAAMRAQQCMGRK